MAKRSAAASLRTAWQRGMRAMTRQVVRAMKTAAQTGTSAGAKSPALARAVTAGAAKKRTIARPPPGPGEWIAGMATIGTGVRRFRLYRPPGVAPGERLPLLVMLHGCGQDAEGFARSTRMNRVAGRERFLVLYPEQSRLANPQSCWNWFEIESGRAMGEAALILGAIDQVCLLHGADRARVAVAGLSAGAGMAALLAAWHPERFKAVVMHSGVPPGVAHSATSAWRAMKGQHLRAALNAAEPSIDPAASGASNGGANETSGTAPRARPPLLVIHGGGDRVVVPGNGLAAAMQWALAAGAPTQRSRAVRRGRRHPMTVTDFKRGARTAATLVEIEGLGHAWSGGAAKEPFSDADGPDASRMVWRFVAKQLRT
ncbi:extracellular catalytic domain type 1 short-chain-length polyhydroxyalkanoate depolymerase [Roseateles amylovorans]|uniref:PHB depolymerase family esterase n=1 Tax=Roseateles amylovorans TaxID=2978473 RepID=A0ABY6B249_9BURK|nr:PHB depolymerase family esterase [Roseateles amylovorans]UXH78992.1 PHB depolymerase family esterase [Roseateles amylovorans]